MIGILGPESCPLRRECCGTGGDGFNKAASAGAFYRLAGYFNPSPWQEQAWRSNGASTVLGMPLQQIIRVRP